MVVMNKAAALLPVSCRVGNDKMMMMKKKKKKAFWLPRLEVVCVWALLTALAFVFAGVFTAMDIPHLAPCSPSSAWNPCAELTDAQDDQVGALVNATLWCSAPEAAAAALALLLPRRRRRSRRALAFFALAAATASHLMHARVLVILVATTPGHLLLKTVATAADSFIVVCDLLGFLGLLFMAGEDE